jgi:CO/xanthine dehydrogenase FAD-binding subunit
VARASRELPIDDFYVANGAFNQARGPDELVTEIVIPLPAPGTLMAYTKLRTRAAIDFPELGVAVRAELPGPDGGLLELDVCVTALAPGRPRGHRARASGGGPWTPPSSRTSAQAGLQALQAADEHRLGPAYRREMVPVFVRRAFRQALARGPVAP